MLYGMVLHCKGNHAIRRSRGPAVRDSPCLYILLSQLMVNMPNVAPADPEASGGVNAGDAGAHAAEKIGSDGADAAGHEIGCQQVAAVVRAVDRGDVAQLHVRNVGDVGHGDVHRDDPDNRGEHAVHENVAVVAERAVDAVAITCREDRDPRRASGYESGIVAHALAGRNVADADDPGTKTHDRPERKLLFRLRAAFDGIVAGMVAVENGPGTHHVGPGLGTRRDGGAVGEVNEAGVDTERAETVDRAVKALFLLAGLRGDRAREDFGRGKVGEDALQLEALAFFVLAGETVDIGRRYAETIHPRVDLQVNPDGALAQFPAGGGGFKSGKLFAADDGGRDPVFEQLWFFAGPETGESEDGFADARSADRFAFGGAGDTKPVRARPFEGLGHLRAAVAVAVAFDD